MQRFDVAAEAATKSRFDEQVLKATSTDAKPIEGSCIDLEKPYLRITTLPKASDVRPEPVLKKAFALVHDCWAEKRDWIYTSEMLRSILQDITVQMLRSPFTVEVCEFGARAALEAGDFKQFDQCFSQLESFYLGADVAGAESNMPEFLAYRLLYLTIHGNSLALSTFLQKHMRSLRASADNPRLSFARKLRAASMDGNLPFAMKIVEGAQTNTSADVQHRVASIGAAQRLSALLLNGLRLQQVVGVCKAHKPVVSRQLLLRCIGAKCDQRGKIPEDIPVVFMENDPNRVNGEATITACERLLAKFGAGGKRLGEQSSDHMKMFVRTNASN